MNVATLFATPQQSLPRTDRQVVRVYLYYRLILAIVLLVMRFGDEGQIHLGQLLPRLYLSVALCYLLSALLAPLLHALLFGSSLNTARLFALFSFDILLFTLLMYSSSGVTSGLGNLSLIAVAAGNILLQGRIGTLLAALATLLVIGEEGYLLLTALPPGEESNRFFQAGVLGTLYFAIALGMQMLSRRLLASDELARQRARDISELQQLNHMIIQRMRTGILVLDRNDDIRMINRAATLLTQIPPTAQGGLRQLSEPLFTRLEQWRRQPRLRPSLFSLPRGPQLQVSFARLTDQPDSDTLLFIEDQALLAQQAQQLKLASLGRLTASIAHELRNPLSAVNHAAQLLDELALPDAEQRRLTHIIQSNARRMNGIIENVQQLSRRDHARAGLLPLAPWLERFLHESILPAWPEAELVWRIEPESIEVRVDPGQLAQILTNLIENGLRYSRLATGRASLRIEAGIDGDHDLPYLAIIDQGEGVADEALDSLFEPFFTTAPKGSGLGLYIARELCQSNQATIDYQRDAGGGSRFVITFSHPERSPGHQDGKEPTDAEEADPDRR